MKKKILLNLLILSCVATVCAAPGKSRVELKDGDNALAVKFVPGAGEKNTVARLELEFANSKPIITHFGARNLKFKYDVSENKKNVRKEAVIKDGICVTFFGDIFCFPNPNRHTEKQRGELLAQKDSFPDCRNMAYDLEFRQVDGGVNVYWRGNYVKFFPRQEKLTAVSLSLEENGRLLSGASLKRPEEKRYTILDLSKQNHPGPLAGAEIDFTPSGNVPLEISGPADVGIVRQKKGAWALECDEQLSRTVRDNMRETLHFSVPNRLYCRAYVLCAVNDEPGKVPLVTARLARFASSGVGEGISDQTIELPRHDGAQLLPPQVKKVGSVSKDGKTLPLYLVEFTLDSGALLDRINNRKDTSAAMMREPYLDFELLGKLGENNGMGDNSHTPDNKNPSSVQVFGVTLEHLPWEFVLQQSQPGLIFHDDDKQITNVEVRAVDDADIELRVDFADVNENIVKSVKRKMTLKKDEKATWPLDLTMPRNGWYGLNFTIAEKGREVFRHNAAFALLGKNTRRAGYDSPFGTWWFGGAHYGCDDPAIVGSMLFKAGLRKTTFAYTKKAEKDFAPYMVTSNQIGWGILPKNPAGDATAEKLIRIQLERFPHVNSIDVFHESHAHFLPKMFMGQKTVYDAAKEARLRKRAAEGNHAMKFIKDKFPQLKIVFGNSWHSASITDDLVRYGLDIKLIDYIGIETLGQTSPPEMPYDHTVMGGSWISREVSRAHGGNGKLTGCYEFTCRLEKNIGLRRQAAWYVRDMLVGLAFGYENVSPGLIYDASNAYANSRWGAGGICRRYPLLYPKMAYVGIATLTKALDCAKFVREVPCGLAGVYVLEFRRDDGKYVYSLHTASGKADVTLNFSRKVAGETYDFWGVPGKFNAASYRITASEFPSYVTVGAMPAKVDAVMRETPDPADFRIGEKMADISKWRHDDGDMGIVREVSSELPLRKLGNYNFRQVNDEWRGKCLELELMPDKTLPTLMGEYTVIRLKNPVAVPGKPAAVALRVKGDGTWGKIAFEIQDANGRLWRSYGDMWHDWPGDLAVKADGWQLLRFPLRRVWYMSPATAWESSADGDITFPIKLVGLYVTQFGKGRTLTDFVERKSPPRLRFCDFGTLGSYEWDETREQVKNGK